MIRNLQTIVANATSPAALEDEIATGTLPTPTTNTYGSSGDIAHHGGREAMCARAQRSRSSWLRAFESVSSDVGDDASKQDDDEGPKHRSSAGALSLYTFLSASKPGFQEERGRGILCSSGSIAGVDASSIIFSNSRS
mmetsp:Transcript_22559/g.64906  ORF Transcript_22559/g.64906 Transcript_22559/m.64906 type:complete len:138 (+) Transcript_22559:129-542(+)